MAGGVTTTGDNTYIQLVRNGRTYNLNTIDLEKAGYSLHKLLVQPNDTIYVSTRENQKFMSWVKLEKSSFTNARSGYDFK